MKQCTNGHWFDETKNKNCPYCEVKIEPTRPLDEDIETKPPIITANGRDTEMGPTRPPIDIGPTHPIIPVQTKVIPVCGWLIVCEGEQTGLDFRIHNGRNVIGRDKSFEVNLGFDDKVSRVSNAIIIYDSRSNKFFIQNGEGTNNVYINNTLLLASLELHSNDILEVGSTKLIFRAFCDENFKY